MIIAEAAGLCAICAFAGTALRLLYRAARAVGDMAEAVSWLVKLHTDATAPAPLTRHGRRPHHHEAA